MSDEQNHEYLDEAANAVYRQLEKDPLIGIPVDPDVADHRGATVDDAMDEDDVLASNKGVDENGVAVGEETED